jgi:glyoxylase-like metal-dependent hydrolase (beta-lactamase superfamily II)
VTILDSTKPFLAGDRTWDVFELPGHSDGQVCLYDRSDSLMLIADHILPTITPNISLWPESRPDPLEAYLATLPHLRSLEVRLALPGHKHPFTNWAQRIDEIVEHHDQRLALIEQAAQTPCTAWEICCTIFPMESLSPHQLRFAMAETLAHVVLLEHQGRLVREDRSGRVFFSRS